MWVVCPGTWQGPSYPVLSSAIGPVRERQVRTGPEPRFQVPGRRLQALVCAPDAWESRSGPRDTRGTRGKSSDNDGQLAGVPDCLGSEV